jgi:hypothetical protein
MHLQPVDYFLWLTPPLLQAILLLGLRLRKLSNTFPNFLRYTLLQVISVPALVVIQVLPSGKWTYYYSYWLVNALSIAFAFLLMDELFKLAFHHLPALRDFGRMVFRWAVVVVLVTAAVGSLSSRQVEHLSILTQAILAVDRSSRIMLCALSVLLLLSSHLLHIRRRDLLFGIALGLAAVNLDRVALDSIALHTQLHSQVRNQVNSLVYIAVCILWLGYVFQPTPKECPRPRELEFATPDWHAEEASESAFDSLNEMVERMLDR